MLKNFFIKDLFEVINNPQLDKENFTFSESAEYPYFTRTENNNGILGYVEYLDEEHKIKGNSLAVGMISMKFHYMHHDFYAGQFTKTLMPKFQGFNEKLAMYFIGILNKHSEYYQSFLVRHFKDKVSETVVALPVVESPDPDHEYTVEDIDFEYMKQRIAELEKQRIAELEKQRIAELDAYLIATGLDNYELTDEDKKMLSSSTMQMFKEFDLSVLFDISTTKGVDKNKLDFAADGEYDFIGRTSVNWGIQGKLHKLSFEPNPKDSFSLVQVGETVTLWREKEWYASQNLFLLTPKIDKIKENKLYFQGVINKEMSRYGKEYNIYPTLKSLAATKILLPVVESPDPDHEYTVDDIDWQYMRERIAELERERIAELERERIAELDAYLIATGLDNYELTDEDKEMLSSSTMQIFKSFYLKDIFGSEPIRGARLTKEHRISGNIPLITAGEQNEGVAEYISNQENQTLSNMLTIDMFGNCFYRDYLYKSDDNILSFGLNGKSTEEMLYIASIINSICKKQYNYARQYRKDSYLETTIPLPVIESPDPDHEYTPADIDWHYMERYIRAIEKLAIADVVEHKNRMIAAAKQVINT